MKVNEKYHGVVVPMVTPVTKDGDVDLKAVEKIIENFARNNVSALIMGTTGEGNSVSAEQGARMIETAARTSGGRVLIYAGLCGTCWSEQLRAAELFAKAGADVIAATLPSYYSLTPDQMYEYYKNLSENISVPLMLYNITITTHMSIPLDVIERLSRIPNIVGLKDSENDLERMEQALKMFANRDDFAYFCGCAANSAHAMKLGADGIVPSVGNYAPELYNELFEAALRGDFDEAERLQRLTIDMGKVNTTGLTLGQSLAGLKVIMKQFGLCETYMLPPLTELDAPTAERIKSEIKRFY